MKYGAEALIPVHIHADLNELKNHPVKYLAEQQLIVFLSGSVDWIVNFMGLYPVSRDFQHPQLPSKFNLTF